LVYHVYGLKGQVDHGDGGDDDDDNDEFISLMVLYINGNKSTE